MAKQKKLVEDITPMDEDFARWYTDVVTRANLMRYSSVKGCMMILPAGYALWENIQKNLDAMFKETGVQNVYMPIFIPESLLNKEKDHVEGFAPEVAWVTKSGEADLEERMCVRPTSETIFCELYSEIVQSYRDLPKLYNQWCSVVRMEKTTRPFLRSSEFLWQEGHTAHATAKEADERTRQMLDVYVRFAEEYLAIPMIRGRKTEKEKFAGAKETFTMEALMHDGKALQSGTSHNFGDGFAKAFDITFTDKDNALKHVFQTSWGFSTRIIGAIIMVHGDDSGLVLPPRIAPTQTVVVPIASHKEGVLEHASALLNALKEAGISAALDASDKSPGFKFAEQEIKGIPSRIEIGPKDIENGSCVVVRRDSREKINVPLDKIAEELPKILEQMQEDMFKRALKHRDEHTYTATTYDEFKDIIENKPGFVKAMWCGDERCELKIKEDTTATSRCMPLEQEELSKKCVCCGREAKVMVYWGKAY